MSDERKKPGWAFYATAGLLSLVLYVASIGPAVWLSQKTGWKFILYAYVPIEYVGEKYDPFEKAMFWYIRLWSVT